MASPIGILRIYGTVDQKWRGVVADGTASGYVKDYDWNSVGAVVTPPHYLAPSTASWAISSSPIYITTIPPDIRSAAPLIQRSSGAVVLRGQGR